MSKPSTSRKRGVVAGPDLRTKKMKILMDFDTPDEALNDVCVIVGGQKFYVLKGQLARQSTYFKKLFFENAEDKEKKEFTLKERVDPQNFQYFLELVNCIKSLSDENISGVCHLAELFVAELAQHHCHDYLTEKSRLTKIKLFQLTVKYFFLADIKASIIAEAIDVPDVIQLLTHDLKELDLTTSKMIIHRMIAIHSRNILNVLNPRGTLLSNFPAPPLADP